MSFAALALDLKWAKSRKGRCLCIFTDTMSYIQTLSLTLYQYCHYVLCLLSFARAFVHACACVCAFVRFGRHSWWKQGRKIINWNCILITGQVIISPRLLVAAGQRLCYNQRLDSVMPGMRIENGSWQQQGRPAHHFFGVARQPSHQHYYKLTFHNRSVTLFWPSLFLLVFVLHSNLYLTHRTAYFRGSLRMRTW